MREAEIMARWIEKFGKITCWKATTKLDKIVKSSCFSNLELDQRNATNLKLFFLEKLSNFGWEECKSVALLLEASLIYSSWLRVEILSG